MHNYPEIVYLIESTLRFITDMLQKLGRKYIYVGGIGRDQRWTLYNIEEDSVRCGCFVGTLAQFETQIRENHANNPHHLTEYLGVIEFLKAARMAKLQYPKMKENIPAGMVGWAADLATTTAAACNQQQAAPLQPTEGAPFVR